MKTAAAAGRIFSATNAARTAVSCVGSAYKSIAVSANSLSTAVPDVLPIAQQGYPDFAMTSWYGLFVPIKTPARIIDAIGRVAERAMLAPDVIENLNKQGLEAAYKNPADFKDHIARETAMWAKLIKEANIKAER